MLSNRLPKVNTPPPKFAVLSYTKLFLTSAVSATE